MNDRVDRRAYLNVREALDRERRLNDALLRPYLTIEAIFNDPAITNTQKVALLARDFDHARQLQALVLEHRCNP